MARKITVAELLVKVGVDSDQAQRASDKFSKGLEKAEKRGLKLGSGLRVLGKGLTIAAAGLTAAAVGAAALVNSTSKAFDEIAKGADKTGLATDEFQKFKFAADRSGVSMDVFARAVKNQSRFIDDAINSPTGVTAFTTALSKVGLTLEDVQSEADFGKRLNLIADALKSVESPAERVALAMKLVGEEAGPQLLPLLKDGAEGIEKLKDQAVEFGAVIGEDAIRDGEAFQDSLTNTKSLIGGLASTIAAEALPAAKEMVDELGEWVKANRGMIRQKADRFFDKMFGAIDRLAPAMETVADVVVDIATGFGDVVEFVDDAARAFDDVVNSLGDVGRAAKRALNPVGELLANMERLSNTGIAERGPVGTFEHSSFGPKIAAKSREVLAADAEVLRIQQDSGIGSALFGNKDLERAIAKRNSLSRQQRELEAKGEEEIAALTQGPSLDLFDTPTGEGRFAPIGRPGGKGKDKAKRFSIDSIADVVEGAATGQLGMIADRTPSTKGLEPTVALEIINNNVTVSLENAFHGIEASAVVPTVRAAVREEFTSVLSIAGQKLAGNIQR